MSERNESGASVKAEIKSNFTTAQCTLIVPAKSLKIPLISSPYTLFLSFIPYFMILIILCYTYSRIKIFYTDI